MKVARLATAFVLLSATNASSAAEPPTFQQIVQPYVDQGRFAGANGVVVSRQGILNWPSAGFADIGSRKPMERSTMFWLASTSKPFQATALMMLVDEGKVRLDDPVSKYLPQFQKLKPITVRMLLNHTSGLVYAAQPVRTDCCSLAEMVDRFVSLPLAFDPGTGFQYSNAGPDTASRIVEVVSGQSFETFLNGKLLGPLGMKDTTYFPTDEQLSRLATAYVFDNASGRLKRAPNEVFLTAPYGNRKIRHAPGGGLFSTGEDLALYLQMLLDKGTFGGRRYLSESAVAEMTRNQIPAELMPKVPQPPGARNGPVGYGLGWAVDAKGNYFHPGVTMVMLHVDVTRGFASAFLAQHAPDETAFEILARLADAATQHWDLHH